MSLDNYQQYTTNTQPRTVMVTEGGELIVAVEDLRQDPTLPLPLAAANAGGLLRAGSGGFVDAELERGGSGASDSLLVEGGGGRSSADKFSPVPAAGERMTVLLRAPLADVVEAVEEARDPRYVTLVVREPSAFGLLKRSHTWRLFSEDRRPVDALLRLLRDSVAA